jgi:hypothetical protein
MDISNLFKWKKKYVIKAPDGKPLTTDDGEELYVYLRVIGDNDLDHAKRYSLRQVSKLRVEYELDPDQVLPDFNEFTVEQLASLLVLNEASEIYKRAEREVQIEYPTQKDSTKLEDAEEYVKLSDTYFERLAEKVDEVAQQGLEARIEYYKQKSKKDLIIGARKAYIEKILEGDLAKITNDAILYFCVFEDEDCTKKVFSDIDEVRNAAPYLKEQLYREYSDLVLSDRELKK